MQSRVKFPKNSATVIIGASGGIGRALVRAYLDLEDCEAVFAVSRTRGVKLVAFHPGTTDTYLSSPFQGNVAKGKLFSPDFVADCLLKRLDEVEPDGELSFLDWAGAEIPW